MNFLQLLNEIKNILLTEFSNISGLENTIVSIDIDENFNLIDINGNPIPIVLIELDEVIAEESGAKGQMINGKVSVNILVYIAKADKTFTEYFTILQNLLESIRNIFDMYTTKRFQFINHNFIMNNYEIEGIPIVAAISTYHIPIGNYDLT